MENFLQGLLAILLSIDPYVLLIVIGSGEAIKRFWVPDYFGTKKRHLKIGKAWKTFWISLPITLIYVHFFRLEGVLTYSLTREIFTSFIFGTFFYSLFVKWFKEATANIFSKNKTNQS